MNNQSNEHEQLPPDTGQGSNSNINTKQSTDYHNVNGAPNGQYYPAPPQPSQSPQYHQPQYNQYQQQPQYGYQQPNPAYPVPYQQPYQGGGYGQPPYPPQQAMVPYYQTTAYGPEVVGPQQGDEEGGQNFIQMILDRLHERWKPMLIVGGILAAILAPIGFLATGPVYQSRGFVHVAPKLDYVVHETPETEIMPFYTQYVQSQAAIISTERVLQEALKSDKLREYKWTKEPEAILQIQENLKTEAPARLQHIIVTYASDDPKEAAVVLNAVLTAYEKEVGSTGSTSVSSKLDKLNARKISLTSQLNSKRAQLLGLKSVIEFDTQDLQDLQKLKIAELEDLDRQLDAIRVAEAISPGSGVMAVDGQERAIRLTASQLDAIDPQLANLRRLRDVRQNEFDQIRDRMGPNSRIYQRAERDLEVAERLLTEREERARNEYVASGGKGNFDSLGPNGDLSADQLEAKKLALTKLRAEVAEDVSMINADRNTADIYTAEMSQFQDELAQVQNRMSDLDIEGESNDRARVSVFQKGTIPAAPAKDQRFVFSLAGIMGGFGLSFGIFFLLGTLDQRAYRVQQLQESLGLDTLGVLPDLNETIGDEASAEVAAHCIHQIRNFIEARRTHEKFVIAVTSPFQGDGKTSITSALGQSYAQSGNRTIIVDGDMVGRGLSRSFNMVGSEGLKDAIRSGNLNGEVVNLGEDMHELHVLPVGMAHQVGPHSLRRHHVEQLFQQLRERFDVILVDTGPVLGSLESVPIVSAADATVLAVRRGRQRERLSDCMRSLNSVGARFLGVVLNCADEADCNRYVSESSLAMPDLPDGTPAPTRESRSAALTAAMKASANPEVYTAKPAKSI